MFSIYFKKRSAPEQSITRWFLVCFTCVSIIFSIALIPLISYCRNVFTELEIKKSTQQMDFGISQLENTVTSIASASQSLTNATQFISFHYLEPDYSSISISVRNQLKNYLNSLIFPLTLVSDSALQFSADCAVTPTHTVFYDKFGYYPYRFSVDDLSYDEWVLLLNENDSGFMPVHRVTTPFKTYDALIYSIPWTKNSYLYTCLDVSAVKRALIDEPDLDSYYLTISDSKGNCLYSDLEDTSSDYHSVTQKTSVGNLVVTIHIPTTALTARMSPLYFFLGLYISTCILVLLVTSFAGSHLSSKPLLKILNVLESHDTQHHAATDTAALDKRPPSLHYGFHYMQEQVNLFERDLNEYRNTIYTQKKVLQSRYMEKALHGSLNSTKDKEAFHSYFPNFPQNYCLVQFGLTEEETSDSTTLYPDSLYLVQAFIQNELPHAYQLQMSDSELLLIIAEEDFEQYHDILNHLIDNINREEPSYLAWGVASRFYHHLESLPTAYWQLQDMSSMISHDSPSQLYTTSDYLNTSRPDFQIADIMTMYTAITYGNKELALQKLQNYSCSLHTNNRSVFEIIRAILLYIKQEYPDQLLDTDIPLYHSECDMYSLVENVVSTFCDKLLPDNQSGLDPFVQELVDYIDAHFKEYDLCLTALEQQFKCSTSKIQKAFKKATDITVSDYIEKKRMDHANSLLFGTEMSTAEIARECGFANANSFYKAYRRIYGHSPTSVKRKN